MQEFKAEFILNETIDFALLTDYMQIQIIKRVSESDDEREVLINGLRRSLGIWEQRLLNKNSDVLLIQKNRALIRI